MNKYKEKYDEELVVEDQKKTEKPRLYKVILLNDDYTTMDFVVTVLMKFFYKSESEAVHMGSVKRKGGLG